MRYMTIVAALAGSLSGVAGAMAQDDVESIPFEGGEITITEKDTGEKELAYDGRTIASDYVVFFDRTVEIDGRQVALASVGPGGNACGTSTIILWKDEAELLHDTVGDDCGSPEPAVGAYAIYFVPYLLPGETGVVQQWTPDERLVDFGQLAFAPRAETGWADIDAAKLEHPLDLFRNADFYSAAKALLGDELTDYAAGLGTASKPEEAGGLITAKGCTPHACGLADSFLAIDLPKKQLYLAQQAESGSPETWPALDGWPEAARKAMTDAIGGQ